MIYWEMSISQNNNITFRDFPRYERRERRFFSLPKCYSASDCTSCMRTTSPMTKREAKANFLAVSVPEGLNDKPAMRYAWGLYTDLLCKDGYITMKQYETWTCPF